MVDPYVSAAARWLREAAERAVRAFLAAFVGALTVAVPATDLSAWRSVLVAAVAAGVSAVLSLFARARGSSASASFLKE
jgi:hypothetical protein